MSKTARLSIIIPAYRAERTLSRVLGALRPQIGADTEVLVVESSGSSAASALERTTPWVQVISLTRRTLPGAARNLGARAAVGTELVFLDADAVPGPTWLASLRASSTRTDAIAIAGAVRNGTPASAIGTSAYLLEFSELFPHRRGLPLHGATCNLFVTRDSFEAAGGFCEDIWPGEDTILTAPWGRAGRLQFASDAAVWHLNRTGADDLLRHQHRLGRSFVVVCDRVELPYARFSRWPLLAAAPLLRLGALGGRLSGHPALLRRAGRLMPLLAVGLTAWTAGVAAQRRDQAPKR